MVILLTGATSKIGQVLLTRLVTDKRVSKVFAVSRSQPKIQPHLDGLVWIQGDLINGIEVPQVDLCIHMAGVTHTYDQDLYFEVNRRSTLRLANDLQKKGCKRFWYISSQTAGLAAGAYAESKFLAEKDLLNMNWEQILIFRPAEVVGAGGNEGLDKFESLAKKIRVSPWLLGIRPIMFAPLSADRLVQFLVESLYSKESQKIQVLRGPWISSTRFAWQTAQRFGAIPIPVFLPLLGLIAFLLRKIGLNTIPQDQIPRLLGRRGQKPTESVVIETVEL